MTTTTIDVTPSSALTIPAATIPAASLITTTGIMDVPPAISTSTAALPAGEGLVPAEKILQRVARGWQTWPDAQAARAQLITLEAQEQAMDVPVAINALRATRDTARLFSAAKPGAAQHAVGYTLLALRHLASFVDSAPRGLANVLCDLPPALRAPILDHYTGQGARDVIMRMWRPGGGARCTRAVTSDRHADVSDSALAALFTPYAGVKLQVSRSLSTTEIVALIPSTARHYAKGDIVCKRVTVSNNHVKGASLIVAGGTFQLGCLNGATRVVDGVNDSVRHVGSATRLLRHVASLIEQAMANADGLITALEDAYAMPFPQALPSRSEVLERVGKIATLPETLISDAARLWDADGAQLSAGNTLAGLVNSITRAAQLQPVTVAADAEAWAGATLMMGWQALALPSDRKAR